MFENRPRKRPVFFLLPQRERLTRPIEVAMFFRPRTVKTAKKEAVMAADSEEAKKEATLADVAMQVAEAHRQFTVEQDARFEHSGRLFMAAHIESLKANPTHAYVLNTVGFFLENVISHAYQGQRELISMIVPREEVASDEMKAEAEQICDLLRKAGLKVEVVWTKTAVEAAESPTGACLAEKTCVVTITW
jgi:hypothetical protein